MIFRRTCVCGPMLVLAFGLGAGLTIGPETARADDTTIVQEITPELRTAIDRGFAYLASIQSDNGSFDSDRYGQHVGITSLACLALMADGHLPGRGAYGPQIERGLDFVLDHALETGLIAANTSHGPMYGHGFATLFLGEIYGMTGDPRCREALVRAVRLIVDTQNHEGGWRYNPVPNDADISVTICQVMALRAARNAGIKVPRETIDKAVEYVRACQDKSSGGFGYTSRSRSPAYPRSAAGVASLYYAGIYEGDDITRGLDYLVRHRPHGGQRSGHYWYGEYYASQAMFLAGGEYWAGYYPPTRTILLNQQNENGSWSAGEGDAYGTAMALIVLQMPHRYLPIFQR